MNPLSVSLTLALACATVMTAAPAPAPKPKMGSKVFAWDAMVAKPTPNGERRDVANHATPTLGVFECHITTLNPGKASHLPHRHPQEELIIVKEGTLEVHINGVETRAGPGSAFLYLSNDAHAVKNVGDTRATYWVINLATSLTHDPAKFNPAPSLKSAVHDWEKIPVQVTKTGARRQILNGSTVTIQSLTLHATTVNVGLAAHGAHRHADDEVIVVKEGTLEIDLEGTKHRAPAGSVCFYASNDLHGMRNLGDTPVTYYVIRLITPETPKPPAKS